MLKPVSLTPYFSHPVPFPKGNMFIEFNTEMYKMMNRESPLLSMTPIHPDYFPSNNDLNFAYTLKYIILN